MVSERTDSQYVRLFLVKFFGQVKPTQDHHHHHHQNRDDFKHRLKRESARMWRARSARWWRRRSATRSSRSSAPSWRRRSVTLTLIMLHVGQHFSVETWGVGTLSNLIVKKLKVEKIEVCKLKLEVFNTLNWNLRCARQSTWRNARQWKRKSAALWKESSVRTFWRRSARRWVAILVYTCKEARRQCLIQAGGCRQFFPAFPT